MIECIRKDVFMVLRTDFPLTGLLVSSLSYFSVLILADSFIIILRLLFIPF